MQKHTAAPSAADPRDRDNTKYPISTQTEPTHLGWCGSRYVMVHLTRGWCGWDKRQKTPTEKWDSIMMIINFLDCTWISVTVVLVRKHFKSKTSLWHRLCPCSCLELLCTFFWSRGRMHVSLLEFSRQRTYVCVMGPDSECFQTWTIFLISQCITVKQTPLFPYALIK